MKNFLIVFLLVLFSSHTLFSGSPVKKDQKSVDEDVKELEELIEGKKGGGFKREPSASISAEKEEKGSFYRSFGNNMSIRGDGKFIYIKAGPTSIIVDPEGRLQIEAAENVVIQSKKSIYMGAGEDINLIAGGKINQSQGAQDISSTETKEEIKEEGIAETQEEKDTKPEGGRAPAPEVPEIPLEKGDLDSEPQEESAPSLSTSPDENLEEIPSSK